MAALGTADIGYLRHGSNVAAHRRQRLRLCSAARQQQTGRGQTSHKYLHCMLLRRPRARRVFNFLNLTLRSACQHRCHRR